jgi:hypothetical protein
MWLHSLSSLFMTSGLVSSLVNQGSLALSPFIVDGLFWPLFAISA